MFERTSGFHRSYEDATMFARWLKSVGPYGLLYSGQAGESKRQKREYDLVGYPV